MAMTASAGVIGRGFPESSQGFCLSAMSFWWDKATAALIWWCVGSCELDCESRDISTRGCGRLLPAGLADLHGALHHLDWKMSAAASCQSFWCSGCKSCHDTLQKQIAKTVNKKLGIELGRPRQNLCARTWQGFGKSKDVEGQTRTAE